MTAPGVASVAGPTLATAAGLVLMAAFLIVLHLRERRRRTAATSYQDALYYRARDVRRCLGFGLMGLIAVVMAATCAFDPRSNRAAGRLWVGLWLAVLLLVVVLLVLALLDWSANRRYAARQWRGLRRERVEALADLARLRLEQRRAARGRRPGPPSPDPSVN